MLAAFGIEPKGEPDLDRWRLINERIRNPEGDVTIAIVGKYTGLKDAYKSLIEALSHGGIANKVRVNLDWIESEVFEREDPAPFLEHVNGILVPGGFGQRGTEGKIRAAQFARERQVPYFGICFGMQMAVIEAARNLCGIEDANSTEFGTTPEPVVGLMTEWMKGNELHTRGMDGDLGGTMRLGAYPALLQRGSRVSQIYHGATRNFRAPPPPLRGEYRLQGPARAARHAFFRHVARRAIAGDDRIRGSSLVHRRAVPSRAQVAAVRAAPAFFLLHRRGGRPEPAGVALGRKYSAADAAPIARHTRCHQLRILPFAGKRLGPCVSRTDIGGGRRVGILGWRPSEIAPCAAAAGLQRHGVPVFRA